MGLGLILLMFTVQQLHASCTPDFTITEPGLSPPDSLFPCIIRNEEFNEVLNFKNYDSVEINQNKFKLESLKILKIKDMPEGIYWETNKNDSTFNNKENGCIRFVGITSSNTGHYELDIMVAVKIDGFDFPITMSAKERGLVFTLTVINAGDSCIKKISTSIEDIFYSKNKILEPVIFPNPVNHFLNISIYSDHSQSAELYIFDLSGKLIQTYNNELITGMNLLTLETTHLQKGMYFLQIHTKSMGVYNGRVVVE